MIKSFSNSLPSQLFLHRLLINISLAFTVLFTSVKLQLLLSLPSFQNLKVALPISWRCVNHFLVSSLNFSFQFNKKTDQVFTFNPLILLLFNFSFKSGTHLSLSFSLLIVDMKSSKYSFKFIQHFTFYQCHFYNSRLQTKILLFQILKLTIFYILFFIVYIGFV